MEAISDAWGRLGTARLDGMTLYATAGDIGEGGREIGWEPVETRSDEHGAEHAPTLTQIEDALSRLGNAASAGGSKKLVEAFGQVWKCMV